MVKFNKCVDGDTIKVLLEGKERTVRLLAVDTPESVHPSKGIEFYGKEASSFTCNLITNAKKIELEYDENSDKEVLIDKLYKCINEIVTIARDHGFNGNLWHGYLTYLLTTNENAFSMSCEKKGAIEGSINELALHDLRIFKEAYDVDWDDIEKVLGVHFISMIRAFQNPDKLGVIYSQSLRLGRIIQIIHKEP